jgi:hypothetical protein
MNETILVNSSACAEPSTPIDKDSFKKGQNFEEYVESLFNFNSGRFEISNKQIRR